MQIEPCKGTVKGVVGCIIDTLLLSGPIFENHVIVLNQGNVSVHLKYQMLLTRWLILVTLLSNTSHMRLPFRNLRFQLIFALQLYWNHTSAWVFPCKFAMYFQNTFFEEQLWRVVSGIYMNIRVISIKLSTPGFRSNQ